MAARRYSRPGIFGLVATALLAALLMLRVQSLCAMPDMPAADACQPMLPKAPVHQSQAMPCAALCAAAAAEAAAVEPATAEMPVITVSAVAAALHGLNIGPAPPPPRVGGFPSQLT